MLSLLRYHLPEMEFHELLDTPDHSGFRMTSHTDVVCLSVVLV